MTLLSNIVSGARTARLGVVTQKHTPASIIAEVEQRTGKGFRPDLTRIRDNDPLKLAALNLTDFTGNQTALESILEIADAGTLRDGRSSLQTATTLFHLAGETAPVSYGNCYGRTLHSIFSAYHAGEFNQILADLLLRGETVLASGQRVHWDPSVLPVTPHGDQHHDVLWGALVNNLRFADIRNPLVLIGNGGYAYRGQMANIATRLFGTQFVNAPGQELLPHLNGIVDRRGPLLAEYGNHGGSVADVDHLKSVTSFESGGYESSYPTTSLGYVVVPESEVSALPGVEPIDYSHLSDDTRYFRLGP